MSISVETLALAKKNTKQVVEEAVTSVYRYKGSVETFEDLPTSGQKVGDVYNVEKEAGRNYAWDGNDWDALGIAENLGDTEFTGADSEIKTINENFWDKDKVQEELDDISNDLSNTSNALNNSINEVSNTVKNKVDKIRIEKGEQYLNIGQRYEINLAGFSKIDFSETNYPGTGTFTLTCDSNVYNLGQNPIVDVSQYDFGTISSNATGMRLAKWTLSNEAAYKTDLMDYYDKDASNSLANDTLNAAKAYTDSKFDISLKKEVVQELPAEGEEDILYLVPKQDSSNEDIYDEYIWTNNEWEKIGSTATDLSGYYTSNQVDNIVTNVRNDVTNAANQASCAISIANSADNVAAMANSNAANASNLAQAAYDKATAAWQEISNVTTNEVTNSVTLPIDKNYDEYLITFNRPIVMDGPNPADSMTSNDGSLLLSIGGQAVIGSKLSIYNKMDGIYNIKRIIDNMYYGTGYHNSLMSNMKDYTENIVDINDASNGGIVLSTSSSGSTANIASNITITVYGKGGEDTK